jgi:hypothetical protein
MDLATLTLRDYTADLTGDMEQKSAHSGNTNTRTTLRRCRSREQGSALLKVGHAIEYLVESRLVNQQVTTLAEREALAILLRANLNVYNEGAEVVTLATRLRSWFHGGGNIRPGGIKHEPASAH